MRLCGVPLAGLVGLAACSSGSSLQTTSIPAASSASDSVAMASASGAPRAPAVVSTPASALPAATTQASVTAPSMAGATGRVGRWGLTIQVPAGARSEHEATAQRHTVHVAYQVEVELRLADGPGPATLEAAKASWEQGSHVRSLGEGQTADGIFYGLRTFEVREGFSGGRGRHVHHLKDVSRVYATLGLDETHHVVCTGHVESGATSAEDRSLRAVRDICLSMRKAP